MVVAGATVQKTRIPIIAVSCGDRADELIQMLKSALIFSQDAHLDATVIADEDSIHRVGEEVKILLIPVSFVEILQFFNCLKLVELQRQSNMAGWDFTFTLLPKKYPRDTENWFRSKRWLCSTLRLFFPVRNRLFSFWLEEIQNGT